MDINIKKNHGIVSAIKTELNNQGYDTSKTSESIWTQVMKEVQTQNEQNKAEGKKEIYRGGSDLFGSGHTNFVVSEGIIQLSKNIWDNICKLFDKKDSAPPVQQENSASEIKQPVTNVVESKNANFTLEQNEASHKKVVEQSIQNIEKYFEESGLSSHFKTLEDKQLFLQCLKEVTYEREQNGSGFAEAGIIHIQTNNKEVNDLAHMTRLLIHEANHAFLERKSAQEGTLNFPNKAEEVECETLALTTMSYLVRNSQEYKDSDYEIYGKMLSEFTDANSVKNSSGFENWLNGYQMYADNLNGDITIQHSLNPDKNSPKGQIHIKNGDVITIQGERPRTIGSDAYMEGRDDTAIAQLIMHKAYYKTAQSERTPDTIGGHLIFNDLPATPEELRQELGNDFDINNFDLIPFTVSRKNPFTGELEVIYKGNKLQHK